MRAELFSDDAELAPFTAAWDALAVEHGRPFCAPAWMLAWWRHAAPPGALLRTVVVMDGDETLGVAPFFAESRRGLVRYRLLGSRASLGLEPLAARGAEREAAALVAEQLDRAEPRPDIVELEGVPSSSPWPRLLRDAWPGGATLRRELSMPSPTLVLEGRDYDQWFASKSSNFRHQARRLRRRLEEQGARFRQATGEELERALGSFAELHHARWDRRGGSGVLTPGVERMLPEVARELAGEGRFRVWLGEVEGRIVVADVWLAAGGELSHWMNGFDDEWGRAKVTVQSILVALEDAFARGYRRVDFGGGKHQLKSRFAEGEDTLEWFLLLPPGPRRPLVRAALIPRQARRAAAERLSPEAKARIKKLLRRA